MTTIREIVARNLRCLRKARSFSQEELGLAAGVDRTYISDIENEKYGASIDIIEDLAVALYVMPWEILHPETYRDLREKDGKEH
jgi:transcriptional regulator with XRE-family HTH domain